MEKNIERIDWPDGTWWEFRAVVTRGMRKRFNRAGLAAIAKAGINVDDPGDLEIYLRSHPGDIDLDAIDDAYLLEGTTAYSFGELMSLEIIDALPDSIVRQVLARMRELYSDISEAQMKNLDSRPPSGATVER